MISLEINGIRELARELSAMDNRLSPGGLGVFMAHVAHPHMVRRVEARFESEGDKASGDWKPLEESTNLWRQSLGFSPAPPGKINSRTGHLRDAIVSGKADVGYDGLGSTLKFPGLEDRADLFHRQNQASGRGRGPARPVIAYDATDVASLLGSLTAFIQKGVTK